MFGWDADLLSLLVGNSTTKRRAALSCARARGDLPANGTSRKTLVAARAVSTSGRRKTHSIISVASEILASDSAYRPPKSPRLTPGRRPTGQSPFTGGYWIRKCEYWKRDWINPSWLPLNERNQRRPQFTSLR